MVKKRDRITKIFSLAGRFFCTVFKRFETQKSHGFKTLELQSFETSTMPQYSFQKLRILVVLKRQYKIVLKQHKNARFKTAFLSIFETKIHNFCYHNSFFCIFETIFGGLIRYKGTPRNISFESGLFSK